MPKINDQQWAEFVEAHREANFLQSVEWGRLYEQQGKTVVRQFIYGATGQVAGGWQGVVKNAKRGRYLEIAGGPLIDWQDASAIETVRAQLEMIARKYHCVFVRFRPQQTDDPELHQRLTDTGFRKAPFHLHADHTNILDLTQKEDDILAKMRRQTRYEVRRSGKQDLTIEVGSTTKMLEEFYEIQQETASRQGFIMLHKPFILGLIDAFGDSLKIYRVQQNQQTLNMAIIIWSGEEASYFEAASTPSSRQFAGAYGLLWQAIIGAKQAGLKRFNFWGIAENDKPNHRFAGVTTFKRGFGGQDVNYLPAHDLPVKKIAYLGNWLVETIRRKIRKL